MLPSSKGLQIRQSLLDKSQGYSQLDDNFDRKSYYMSMKSRVVDGINEVLTESAEDFEDEPEAKNFDYEATKRKVLAKTKKFKHKNDDYTIISPQVEGNLAVNIGKDDLTGIEAGTYWDKHT